jgi:mannose-6-phosphate isomerase-like protein (cupin superfamily)
MAEKLKLGPHDSLEIVSVSEEAFEVEASYRPEGSPPPAHFHPDQDEHFEVLAGEMRARVDGEELELPAGAELEVGRGQVHQMWNPGSEEARVRWVTTPAGRTEEWFRVLDGLFREDGDIAAGRPVDFGALLEEYSDVFRLELGEG